MFIHFQFEVIFWIYLFFQKVNLNVKLNSIYTCTGSLRPAFLMSRGRQGVQMALGVPTVKRDKQSYLMSTLHNLITNMDEEEQNETMIVVFVGETDIEYVQLIAKQIEVRFSQYVENGLIEVLSPPSSYYPNMEKLKITLNDPIERVRWRSKQNLDFAFLMAYAQPKATFYVQLEDDILAKRGFVTIMKNFALDKTVRKEPWFVLDFCQLGFIGEYLFNFFLNSFCASHNITVQFEINQFRFNLQEKCLSQLNSHG